MKNGMIRLIAAVTLAVIIFPIIFPILVSLPLEFSIFDLLSSLADAIPFGNELLDISVEFINTVASVCNTVLNTNGISLNSFQINISLNTVGSNHFFAVELMKVIMVSVVCEPIEIITGFLTKTVNKGFFNRLANVIFQVTIVFISTLVVNKIFDFFQIELIKLPYLGQNIVLIVVILIVLGGGVFSFMVLLGSVVKALIRFLVKTVLINILKSIIAYLLCFTILLTVGYENYITVIFLPIMILIWWVIIVFENSIDTYIKEV